MVRTFVASVSLLLLLSSSLEAATRRRASSGGLRRKVHVADLITTPGTIEAEWYQDFGINGGYQMPTLLKITPFSLTELSVGFDPAERDGATLSALRVIASGQRFSLAGGPMLHVGGQSQLGGYGLARWDLGSHNLGITASWLGVLDVGAGYGLQWKKWTPHVNLQWERPRASRGYWSVVEGLGYSLGKRTTLDITVLHVGSATAKVDHQLQVGVIYNFGKFRR